MRRYRYVDDAMMYMAILAVRVVIATYAAKSGV